MTQMLTEEQAEFARELLANHQAALSKAERQELRKRLDRYNAEPSDAAART